MTIPVIVSLTLINIAFGQTAETKSATGNNPLIVNEGIKKAKAAITEILKDKVEIRDKQNQISGWPNDLLVLDDRIDFKIKNKNTAINFSEFSDELIEYPPCNSQTGGILKLGKFEFISSFRNREILTKLGENIIVMQNLAKRKRYDAQLTLFKPIAAKYCERKVKPPVSEEQRKFIVQANSFNEQKLYDKAIELYNKAIKVDQIAYPAGYSNLALLAAQINSYDAAIYYMKKYLMLEPNGSDARSAQDKIYEWEAQITK